MINPNAYQPRRKGFTLVELLIVIAILSIVLGFSRIQFGNSQARFQVREQAVELSRVLTQARTESQRYNSNVTVQLSGTTGYTITRVQNGQNVSRSYTLPTGTTIAEVNGGTSVTYLAPYGEVGNTGVTLKLTKGSVAFNVGITGLTGKVVIYQ